MPADHLEHPAYEALRGPVAHDDPPTGPAHAHQLGGHPLGSWREHRAEEAGHRIKRGVPVGEHPGFALVEAGVQALVLGAGLDARSMELAAMSTPVTRTPARAAGMEIWPAPQATSSMRVPGST